MMHYKESKSTSLFGDNHAQWLDGRHSKVRRYEGAHNSVLRLSRSSHEMHRLYADRICFDVCASRSHVGMHCRARGKQLMSIAADCYSRRRSDDRHYVNS